MAITTDAPADEGCARAAGSALDALCTMTCGRCGKSSPADAWSETPVSGELPVGQFQCPKCHYAYRRQRFQGDAWRRINGEMTYRPVDLIEVDARL